MQNYAASNRARWDVTIVISRGSVRQRKTMVLREIYEADFLKLIRLLEVKPEALNDLLQLSTQLTPKTEDDKDLETQRQEAIALCRRHIQATVDLNGDGRINREEYLRRVEINEREIVSWNTRTTSTEERAIQLSMCVQAVANLRTIWEVGSDEDKQGMARHLFEYITYDLGTGKLWISN